MLIAMRIPQRKVNPNILLNKMRDPKRRPRSPGKYPAGCPIGNITAGHTFPRSGRRPSANTNGPLYLHIQHSPKWLDLVEIITQKRSQIHGRTIGGAGRRRRAAFRNGRVGLVVGIAYPERSSQDQVIGDKYPGRRRQTKAVGVRGSVLCSSVRIGVVVRRLGIGRTADGGAQEDGTLEGFLSRCMQSASSAYERCD